MCLATKMSPKKKAEFKEQTEGYKVLLKTSQGLVGEFFSVCSIRPVGEWLDQEEYSGYPRLLRCSNGTIYPPGWHIWLTLEGAKRWIKGKYDLISIVIQRVQFREPLAYGWQLKQPIVVAKEMMILKEAQ